VVFFVGVVFGLSMFRMLILYLLITAFLLYFHFKKREGKSKEQSRITRKSRKKHWAQDTEHRQTKNNTNKKNHTQYKQVKI
jgi:uncharacterized membrane protein